MAEALLYPIESVLAQVAALTGALAAAKVRLFKDSLGPVQFGTSRAALLASECNFDGYPAGGIAVPSWTPPTLAPGQGAMSSSAFVQFVTTAAPGGVGNVVGGAWLETAGGTVWIILQFPEGVPLQVAGQGFPISFSVGVGSG